MIGLNDLHEQIRCVPCHGSLYPNPRNLPLMQIQSFHLPLCPRGNYVGLEEKQKLEEKYQKANIRQSLLNSMLERENVHHEFKECLKTQAEALFKLFLVCNLALIILVQH
jgi:hypothetical protein